MHLAIALDLGGDAGKTFAGRSHPKGGWTIARAEHGMRQKCDFGRQSEVSNHLGRHQRNARQVLGIGLLVDEGVRHEEGMFGEHQGVERSQAGCSRAQADDVTNMAQMFVKASDQTAQHGIGVAAFDHQRRDQGVRATYLRLGQFRGDAVAAHSGPIVRPVVPKARVVFGINQVKITPSEQRKARLLQAVGDHFGPTDQGWSGQAFVEDGR